MPRKTPVPSAEKQISARFRSARERAGFKQSDLAREVRVNVNTLSTYEHGRSPIPYRVAASIAAVTDTCQRWLATGEPPLRPHIQVDSAVAQAVPTEALFSEVYAALLQAQIEAVLSSAAVVSETTVAELSPLDFPSRSGLWAPPLQRSYDELAERLGAVQLLARTLDPSALAAVIGEVKELYQRHRKCRGRGRATWAETVDSQRADAVESLKQKWASFVRSRAQGCA